MRRIWQTRWELFWALFFARIAGAGRSPSDRCELHDDLARLYLELARSYRNSGDLLRAKRAEEQWFMHARLGTPPEPGSPGALGMPHPPEYLETDAYDRSHLTAKTGA